MLGILSSLVPSSWHVIVTADDKCRAEHVERNSRGLEEKLLASKEVSTDYSEQKPWSACLRIAASHTHFFNEQVRHPPAWEAAGSRGAPLAPDEKVATLHLLGSQLAIEPHVGKEDKSDFHAKTRKGLEICFRWNDKQGKCGEAQTSNPYVSGRVHVCQKCFSDLLSSSDCPQLDWVRRSLLLAFRKRWPL